MTSGASCGTSPSNCAEIAACTCSCVSTIQHPIYAGATRVLGKSITPQDYNEACRRMKQWAPTTRAQHATFYALRFLSKVFSDEHSHLTGKEYSATELRDRVEDLAKGLSKEFGWMPNEGSEWNKVVGVFSLNTVSQWMCKEFCFGAPGWAHKYPSTQPLALNTQHSAPQHSNPAHSTQREARAWKSTRSSAYERQQLCAAVNAMIPECKKYRDLEASLCHHCR